MNKFLSEMLFSDSTKEQRKEMFASTFGEIKPCPFCGKTDIDYEADDLGFITNVVRCQKCGSSSADIRWNYRA